MTAADQARYQSEHGPRFGTGECLMRVRQCYQLAARYPSAAEAWQHAEHKHRTSNAAGIPAGVPVFWTGGRHGYGHVAISTGRGYCWSTDIRRDGYFDHVPITLIRQRWGLELVGWAEDLNGARVWNDPAKGFENMDEKQIRQLINEAVEAALFAKIIPVPPGALAARGGARETGQKVSIPDAIYWAWRDSVEDQH